MRLDTKQLEFIHHNLRGVLLWLEEQTLSGSQTRTHDYLAVPDQLQWGSWMLTTPRDRYSMQGAGERGADC